MISATYKNHMGGDIDVVEAARQSFDERPTDVNKSLIQYLERGMSSRDWNAIIETLAHTNDPVEIEQIVREIRDTPLHWSPFSHVVVKVQCRAPLFIARQAWKSHVGFNGGDAGSANGWNEESRRYVDSEPECWTPDAWRKRAENVKQGSSDEEFEGAEHRALSDIYDTAMLDAYNAYKELLRLGVAPEQARAVLPMATLVSWTWTGSLAAWARFCKLRQDSHAQAEIRTLADQISDICRGVAPVSWAALTRDL